MNAALKLKERYEDQVFQIEVYEVAPLWAEGLTLLANGCDIEWEENGKSYSDSSYAIWGVSQENGKWLAKFADTKDVSEESFAGKIRVDVALAAAHVGRLDVTDITWK